MTKRFRFTGLSWCMFPTTTPCSEAFCLQCLVSYSLLAAKCSSVAVLHVQPSGFEQVEEQLLLGDTSLCAAAQAQSDQEGSCYKGTAESSAEASGLIWQQCCQETACSSRLVVSATALKRRQSLAKFPNHGDLTWHV